MSADDELRYKLQGILSKEKVEEVIEKVNEVAWEEIGKTTRYYYRWRYFLLGKLGGECRECGDPHPQNLTFSHDGDHRGTGRGGHTVVMEVLDETDRGTLVEGEDVPSILCQSCHPKIDNVVKYLR